jgi:uncharacterized protein YcaQ
MPRTDLSLDEARRLALATQGFDRPRPRGAVTAQHLARTIRQLGLLQIDFVNVLTPAHYLIPFSRLGAYRRPLFDDVVYRQGGFTEQWAHEASIIPMETWPLLRHRRESFRVRPWGFEKILNQHATYADEVLDEIRKRGPLGADDLHVPEGASRRLENSWIGTLPRATLEAHFARGRLAVAERRPNFSRTYDLAERLIPREHFNRQVEREPAQRELLLRAAQAFGVGTAADLGDYYRMPIKEARAGLAELVADGELREVRVEGWRDAAYLHPSAKPPKEIRATALLSPFDPMVWFRPRAERLFDFEYRIEIYTPQEKRRWGYYVLPFLMGDRLVARVDLKADRAARRLLVPAAHVEAHAEAAAVAEALAVELRVLADWLNLDVIAVERNGKFARQLAAAIR